MINKSQSLFILKIAIRNLQAFKQNFSCLYKIITGNTMPTSRELRPQTMFQMKATLTPHYQLAKVQHSFEKYMNINRSKIGEKTMTDVLLPNHVTNVPLKQRFSNGAPQGLARCATLAFRCIFIFIVFNDDYTSWQILTN